MFGRLSLLRSIAFLGVLLLGVSLPGVARSMLRLCIAGTTSGDWELPAGTGETGQATGVLVVDQSEDPLFYLDATLTEGPPPMEFRIGQIDGILTDSAGTPLYTVAGVWRTVPRDYTRGVWHAAIYDLDTGERAGRMRGTFTQPPGQQGQYDGEWVLCEYP
jgi:hypothetical protein